MRHVIGFTGVCLFLRYAKVERVAVVFPKARAAKESKDKKYTMPPHEPRLLHYPNGKKKSNPHTGQVIEQFKLPPGLEFPKGTKPSARRESLDSENIVNFSSLIGGRIKKLLPDSVGDRIILHAGECRCEPGEIEWKIRPALAGQPDEAKPYNAYVYWVFDGELPDVKLTPVDSDEPTTSLPELEGDIEIWHVPGHHYPPHVHRDPEEGDPDDDFRWLYELVDVPGHIIKSLPIPVIWKLALAPTTHTCLPGQGLCDRDDC